MSEGENNPGLNGARAIGASRVASVFDVSIPPHEDIYSVERHGDGYAIYFGRSASRHGYNLARLSDIAANGRDLPKLIETGLNAADTITTLTHQLEAERERAVKAEERCEAYKGQVEAGAKEIEALRAVLREKAMEYLALDQQATEALGRAVKAEEELDGWRNQMKADAGEIAQLREALYRIANIGAGSGALTRYKRLIEAEDIARAALKTGEPSHD
ncbi:hypothetical protein [Ancylobacter sp.]|uniref:hypothetical protein n=1 Tax=Ancylobacter sp. TaxID=1872567 RepID=UPI003BA9135E